MRRRRLSVGTTTHTRREDGMRVFVAGASGAIGTKLVLQLINRRHTVIATCRSPEKAEVLRELGAEPVVLDVKGVKTKFAPRKASDLQRNPGFGTPQAARS